MMSFLNVVTFKTDRLYLSKLQARKNRPLLGEPSCKKKHMLWSALKTLIKLGDETP